MKFLPYKLLIFFFGYYVYGNTTLHSNSTTDHDLHNCSKISILDSKAISPAYHIVHISDLGIDFNKLLIKEHLSPCKEKNIVSTTKNTNQTTNPKMSKNITNSVNSDASSFDSIAETRNLNLLVPNNSIYSEQVWIDHYKREQQRYFAYIQTYHLDKILQGKLNDFEKKISEMISSSFNTSRVGLDNELSNMSTTIKNDSICESNSNISLSSHVMEMVQSAIEKARKILRKNENRTIALIWTGGHHSQAEESLIRTLIQACPDMLKRLDELIVGILKSLTDSLNHIPIVYAIGPYDTFEPFRMPKGPNKNLQFLSELWENVIPPSQMNIFRRGGYYALDILGNDTINDASNDTIRIRIISLNTYYFAKSNDLVCDCDDFESPGRLQLLWLNSQLIDAAEKGMTTYIVGHLAPSRVYYKPACYAGYMRLLQDFKQDPVELPRVTGQFFDRVHCMQSISPYIDRDLLRMESERDISNVLLLPRMMRRKKCLKCVKASVPIHPIMLDNRTISNNTIPTCLRTRITSNNLSDNSSKILNSTVSDNTTVMNTNLTKNLVTTLNASCLENSTNTTTKHDALNLPIVIHTCENNHGENVQERKNIAVMMADRRKLTPEIVVSKLTVPEQKSSRSKVLLQNRNILEDMISDTMKSFFGKDDSDSEDDSEREKSLQNDKDVYCSAEEECRWYHNFPRSLQDTKSIPIPDYRSAGQCSSPENPFSILQAVANQQLFPAMNNIRVAPRSLIQPVSNSFLKKSRFQKKKPKKSPYQPTIVDKMLCDYRKKHKRDPLGQRQSSKHSFNLLDMDLDGDW